MDIDLLRLARNELRLWLRQMHGIEQRNATVDATRLDPLILALDERLRDRSVNESDCGGTIGTFTYCCRKHSDAAAAYARIEQAVLDAMTEFTEDDLRKSIAASSLDDPKREARLSYAVCAAELRRRGLEP